MPIKGLYEGGLVFHGLRTPYRKEAIFSHMTTKLPILIISVLILALFSGCVNTSTIGSPILGSWETKVVGLTQSVRFESNGTGVMITTLGQEAFKFQITSPTQILVRKQSTDQWDERSYNMVNNNTLQYAGLTWVRQGSV